MKKIFSLILVTFMSISFAGCNTDLIPDIPMRTYTEILDSGVEPALDKDTDFPISYQYENGCFAFAVKHVLEYKFDETIDLYEAEKIIKKPRKVLWNVEYITVFLNEYDIEMHWYKDAETFFKFLSEGEPLVIQYPYDIGNDRYIGHLVAAFSFDETGVWAADSISGKNIHIDYDLVFNKTGKYTRYGFATVWLEK